MRKGDLSGASLAALFSELAAEAATGCLRVIDPAGEEATVYFADGRVYAVSVPGTRARLGSRLLSSGALAPEALAEALEAQRTELQGWRLGELLIHLGYVEQSVVEAFVREQLREAVWDLLRWPAGRWRFRPGERARDDIATPVSVGDLLGELRSRQDGWAEISRVLHGPAAVVRLSGREPAGAGAELPADGWSLLCKIDGERSVAELARECGYTHFEVGQVLLPLISGGVVEVDVGSAGRPTAGADPAPEPPPPGGVVPLHGGGTFADALQRVSVALTEVLGPAPVTDDPYEVPNELRQPAPAIPAAEGEPERSRSRHAAAAELADAQRLAEELRSRGELPGPHLPGGGRWATLAGRPQPGSEPIADVVALRRARRDTTGRHAGRTRHGLIAVDGGGNGGGGNGDRSADGGAAAGRRIGPDDLLPLSGPDAPAEPAPADPVPEPEAPTAANDLPLSQPPEAEGEAASAGSGPEDAAVETVGVAEPAVAELPVAELPPVPDATLPAGPPLVADALAAVPGLYPALAAEPAGTVAAVVTAEPGDRVEAPAVAEPGELVDPAVPVPERRTSGSAPGPAGDLLAGDAAVAAAEVDLATNLAVLAEFSAAARAELRERPADPPVGPSAGAPAGPVTPLDAADEPDPDGSGATRGTSGSSDADGTREPGHPRDAEPAAGPRTGPGGWPAAATPPAADAGPDQRLDMADTAALLRELSSLGIDEQPEAASAPRPPAPPRAPTPPRPAPADPRPRRRGLFGR